MKTRSLWFGLLCMMALGVTLTACEDDDDKLDDTGSQVELPDTRAYILYEGSSTKNNAGIAFYAPNKDADFYSNIFLKQNSKQLGDTGQSIVEEDGKIYVAVFGSNYIARLNAACVEEGRVSFVGDAELSGGVRYMAVEDGYIYASFHGGAVAKISARTLKVEKKLTGLGDNLEAVVINDGLLYVANSCKADWSVYHKEIKVINLKDFTLKETITTLNQNPYKPMLEENDKIFFISNDYDSVEGYVLQMIDTKNGNKVSKVGIASLMDEYEGTLYLINSVTDWTTRETTNTFFTYDIKKEEMNDSSFLKNAPAELTSKGIYMIQLNPNNGDIYIATSDYVTNGTIYRFRNDGSFVESFDAGGLNPSSMVFFN